MKTSENLIETLLAVYAIILVLCMSIYAIFKILEVDIALATNLLLWSATIFAPIAVLMTYTRWQDQKNAELMSSYTHKIYRGIIKYYLKLDGCVSSNIDVNSLEAKKNEIEVLFEAVAIDLVIYSKLSTQLKLYGITFTILQFNTIHESIINDIETMLSETQSEEIESRFTKAIDDYKDKIFSFLDIQNRELVELMLYR